jgi:integrase
MSKLKVGNITLIVNGYTLNNGLPYFQKAVPAALQERLGKRTVKVRLFAENGNFAVQCHRLAVGYKSLFRAMLADSTIVPSDAKLAGLALLQLAGLSASDGLENGVVDLSGAAKDILHDYLVDHNYEPSPVTRAAMATLDNKLPVLLSECFSIYLDNHQKGTDKKFIASQHPHWIRLVEFLGDKPIKAVARSDARAYRDHRLASGVAPSTVNREFNVLRAVFAKAIRELSLGIPNEFAGIEIANGNVNVKNRPPFTTEEFQLLVNSAVAANDERRRIVLVLAATGARLAEVVGLRKRDFDVTAGCIHIRPHESRSLKTKASERSVPLLPIAIKALVLQASAADSDYMFPAYANTIATKANSASAALNKWSKLIVPDKTMHSFRHTMRDQLRAVSCPEAISYEIGGWSDRNDVSKGYGKGYPLELKRKWVCKAYGWLQEP